MKGLIVLFSFCGFIFATENNVCISFGDYYNDMENNPNCYFNPEADLDVTRIISRNGYPVEAHSALTVDDFMLTLFRIPHGKVPRQGYTPTPVLLQPGMGLNSVSYVDRGNTSLAFLLADAGFDVWLGNFRGSQYSQVHLFLKSDSIAYWNFSFHELGIYDIPAQISLINEVTGQEGNILYLGYSMGNTAGYVYNTIFPEQASKYIKVFINLAPVIYTDNIKSVFKYFTFLWEWAQFLTDGNAFHKDLLKRDRVSTEIMKRICLPYPIQMKLCWLGIMLLTGFDVDQMDPETLPVTTIQHTDSIPAKMVTHFIQGISSHGFYHFNYGVEENIKLYGSETPPPYNLSTVKVPVYIIYGNNDWLSTEQDVLRLYADLPEAAKQHGIYKVNWTHFTHTDFLLAKDAKTLIYDHLIKFLENFNSL
ncbi:lipase member K-like [Agrilus planipennis]|uniref:Lipase n=1 Tax=Agrilus planipennis TaxID=224129 RepID=A0A7F5R6Z8_AGRPL|nr:lipase member K-like [Agrilus planipennis]